MNRNALLALGLEIVLPLPLPAKVSMISRRRIILAIGAGALLKPLTLLSQTPQKLLRIGVLHAGTPVTSGPVHAGFRGGLKDLGWVEGRDVVLEIRWANGEVQRMDGLAAELVALKPDLIFTATTYATLAAKRATRNIPIVFGVASDPVGDGLVASLSRPGGNVTGASTSSVDLVSKRLQLLKECVPSLARVVVLTDPTISYNIRSVADVRSAATQLHIRMEVMNASIESEIDAAFGKLSSERLDGIFIMDSVINYRHRKKIVARVAITRSPAIYPQGDFADEGGLIAYAANYPEQGRRAATYVDKILKGASPTDLPVEQPTRFELIVNQKTAKTIGLNIPQSILVRADRVIE